MKYQEHWKVKTILIDDYRDLSADMILRNGRAACEFFKLNRGQSFEAVMYDYELGDILNGNDVLETMLGFDVYPERIKFVTSSEGGLRQMIQTIEQTGKYVQMDSMREWQLIQ